MAIEVLVEGESLADVEIIEVEPDNTLQAIVVVFANKTGIAVEELLLFKEDSDEVLDLKLIVSEVCAPNVVHHVHRVREIEVTVYYKDKEKTKKFPPSARIQRVLDWAVGPHGFNIDPKLAPEMELAIHGQTEELPKRAHIGRYVKHHHHKLALDLIRGVVHNGSCA